ncbi:MAG: hypothetical protein EOM26_06610 [Alphaproteobacteria bacterium]|nr:hypothetical protein [Alphaproteobacteria bacterium]
MIRVLVLSLVLLVVSAGSAMADRRPSCYSLREAEAEQGIRIHSELMVIGLNCMHLGQEAGLYQKYQSFTSNYSDLISGYESTLIDYFKRSGHPNPVGSLNLMRTAFANKISSDAARMRPDIFCKRYIPRVSQAAAMNRQEVKQWASTFFPSHPVSQPICEQ